MILNIETATKNCSVALASDGVTVAKRDFAGEGYSHAEKLHVFINEVLAEAGITFSDLSAVAVGSGPGSYTGLRIGVSAAKGLCFALDIPLISIETLLILAAQSGISDGLVVPMIDARRMEVYSAVYDADLKKIGQTRAEIITADSYMDANENILVVGDCQNKVKPVLSYDISYAEEIVYPSAAAMSKFSHIKYLASDFEDVAYFEPFYLKDFIAGK